MRKDLLNYIQGIAHNEGANILESNAVEDHLHLLIAVKPIQAPSDLIRIIKTNSSRWIHGNYKNLKDFSWQSGFGVFSVSESAVKKVSEYIKNQEKHHRRIPFQEELKRFLEKHKVKYDSNHYLD